MSIPQALGASRLNRLEGVRVAVLGEHGEQRPGFFPEGRLLQVLREEAVSTGARADGEAGQVLGRGGVALGDGGPDRRVRLRCFAVRHRRIQVGEGGLPLRTVGAGVLADEGGGVVRDDPSGGDVLPVGAPAVGRDQLHAVLGYDAGGLVGTPRGHAPDGAGHAVGAYDAVAGLEAGVGRGVHESSVLALMFRLPGSSRRPPKSGSPAGGICGSRSRWGPGPSARCRPGAVPVRSVLAGHEAGAALAGEGGPSSGQGIRTQGLKSRAEIRSSAFSPSAIWSA